MKNLLFILTLFSLAFASCSSEEVETIITQNEYEPILLDEETISVSNNLVNFYLNFTLDAVGSIDANSDIESKNVVVSPISTGLILSMIANGTESDMTKEICNYLGHPNIMDVNNFASILLNQLPIIDNQSNIKLANSIWVDNQYKLTQDFSNTLESKYLGQISYENISKDPKKVLKTINKWCSNHTDGMIKSIMDDTKENTCAVLLNALYFKGKWKSNPFNPDDTKRAKFTGSTKVSSVDMMHSDYIVRHYGLSENFECVFLPFGNGSFNLLIVIPTSQMTLEQANSMLRTEYHPLMNNYKQCEIEVFLPKFKLESHYDLNKIFNNTKIAGITENLNLNMFTPNISGQIDFSQASSFEVNENGAQVASVTSGEIWVSAPPKIEYDKYTINIDRPFYFFLREISTGACILSGRIADL